MIVPFFVTFKITFYNTNDYGERFFKIKKEIQNEPL